MSSGSWASQGRRVCSGSDDDGPRVAVRAATPEGQVTLLVGGLFDGCGLLAYGLHLAGLEHRWLCDVDEFRQGLLRQRFGVPVYPDVRAVGADAPWVHVIAGGFPCKGASSAGKREGFGHPETVLWFEMLRVIRELRPRYVLVENVADLLSLHRGEVFGEVVGGLAESGYDAEWDCFPASAFGATHRRDRVFITAVANTERGIHRRPESGAVPGEARAGEGERPERQRLRAHAADGAGPAPNAASFGERDSDAQADAFSGGGPARPLSASRGASAAADSGEGGREERPPVNGEEPTIAAPYARRPGVPVEWREYEAAVKRWEHILGAPGPEPLVRRVDDGRTRRVERSRLSALGDGVLVQAGWLCGRRILEHEATLVTELVA
jgi:site-specific DNA-cytosine methylase